MALQTDHFTLLGVPRRLNLDANDLEKKFRTLSRQYHPDFFYNAPLPERRAALEKSSQLNDAFRTLKNPVARIGYLLELEGVLTAEDRSEAGQTKQAPPALLEEVFELNEELDAVRELKASGADAEEWRARLDRAAAPIHAKRQEHERLLQELSARWDALGETPQASPERRSVLSALRDRILERNYINNLLDSISREKGEADSVAESPIPSAAQ